MIFKALYAVFFSPTGTTKRIVTTVARKMGICISLPVRQIDVTPRSARSEPYHFSKDDLVVFGLPVYAGRVPNVLLPWLHTVQGGRATCVPVVLYGNRAFDDGLIELRNLLEENGFCTTAAAAFIGEHAFSRVLAAGRPDYHDLALAERFGDTVGKRLSAADTIIHPIAVDGNDPIHPYYQPRDRTGRPIDIRKVKPKTSMACTHCMRCVALCPMGSICEENPEQITGICIKCGACIKGCANQAKYFDDPGYLAHKQDLESTFTRRAEPSIFFK